MPLNYNYNYSVVLVPRQLYRTAFVHPLILIACTVATVIIDLILGLIDIMMQFRIHLLAVACSSHENEK